MKAGWFFQAAHVWIEHLEKSKAKGGKDWKDVIVLDEAASSMTFVESFYITGHGWGSKPIIPCTMEKFCADMEKALKPDLPLLKAGVTG